MIQSRKMMALAIVFVSTAALANDQPPRFKAGEWQIEISQDGGATFKDSQSKREDGNTSIRAEQPKMVATRCIEEHEAVLSPALLAPGCSVSNLTYTPNGMKADLSCANGSMPMTGSISMTIKDNGEAISGFR